jgi:transketolase N-terminal domain/subunit
MAINSSSNFQISIFQLTDFRIQQMRQLDHFKYFGMCVIKEKGNGTQEIKNHIEQERKVIGCPNSI